jgi:hypothetical protein
MTSADFKPKKWKIALAIVMILFIGLNPSLKDFNEHTGDRDGKKQFDFLLFSVYENGSEQYIGVLLNFIPIT